MQQSHLGEVTIYADITEVRMETRAAECKKLLAAGWVLLGVYPLTTSGEPAPRKSRKGQEENKPQDTPRYVQRMVGYVMEGDENRKSQQLNLCLPPIISMMLSDTAYGGERNTPLGGLRNWCWWYGKSGRGIRPPCCVIPLQETSSVSESPYPSLPSLPC